MRKEPVGLRLKTFPIGKAEVDEGAGETGRRSGTKEGDENGEVIGV